MKYLMPHNVREGYINAEISRFHNSQVTMMYRIDDIESEQEIFYLKKNLESWGINKTTFKVSKVSRPNTRPNSKDLMRLSMGMLPNDKITYKLEFKIGAKFAAKGAE